MRLDTFNKTEDRIIAFSFLSGEIGKPSKEYENDFIATFSKTIENGNYAIYTDIENTLNNMLKNNDAALTTGGIDFYRGIKAGWNKDQLREYLNGNIPTEVIKPIEKVSIEPKTEVKPDIKLGTPNEKYCNDIISGWLGNSENKVEATEQKKQEVEDMSYTNDWLKDRFIFSIKGSMLDRGPYNGEVEYNPNTKLFIIKAGTTIANKAVNSIDQAIAQEINALIDNGTISNRVFKKDYTCTSISRAMQIISKGSWHWTDVEVKGSPGISIVMLREQPELYNMLKEEFEEV